MLPSAQKRKVGLLKQRGKGSYLPSYLEEECKCQQLRLSVGLLEGMGTCRARLQCHDLLETGPRPAKDSERGREGAGMCFPAACLRTSSYLPQSHLWDSHIVSEKEKGETEREKWILEKAGISLGVARAAKRLSTSLLVSTAAYLWIQPQSGFLSPCFWKMWQGFNLKRRLWRALVWSKSEETVSSWPRSLSTQGHSGDILTSLALAYRLSLVHGRLWGNMPQIGMESHRKKVCPSFLSLSITAWVQFWSIGGRWESPCWEVFVKHSFQAIEGRFSVWSHSTSSQLLSNLQEVSPLIFTPMGAVLFRNVFGGK